MDIEKEEEERNSVRTVMEKVEAAIYPDTIFEDRLVLLRIGWPLAWLGDCFFHYGDDQVMLEKL